MKYWKALTAAAMLLGLSACGGGSGDDDKNDPPPPPPGTQGALVVEVKTPVLSDAVAAQSNGATTQAATGKVLSVEFKIADKNGTGYDLGTTIPSFTLVKLIAGRNTAMEDPSIWKSFVYGGKTDASAKAGGDNKGVLEALGNGSYKYTFSFDPTKVTDPYPSDSADNGGLISWDESATHRIGIYFGDAAKNIPVVNAVKDWVPNGSSPVLTRSIVEQQSCNSCHMEQPIHHSNRADPKLCATCHNESNPANTGRRALTKVVHSKHGELAAVDANNVTANVTRFPQDARNCDTCHKDETPATPDAANWMLPHQQPCMACHVVKEEEGHHKGEVCSSCHGEKEGNTKSVSAAHQGRLANEAMGRDKVVIAFDDVRYVAPNIEVDMSVTVNGVPAETHVDLQKFVNGGLTATGESGSKPYVLVNWDKNDGANDGFELSYSGANIPAPTNKIDFKKCEAMGGGKFHCSKAVEGEVTGNLAATVSELAVCVARKGKDGAYAAGDLLPCADSSSKSARGYVAVNPAKAYFHATGGKDDGYQLKAGADRASCNGCHKDLTIHAGMHDAKDFAQCTSCHNATRTSYYAGIPADLKYHVHSYHKFGSHRAEDGSTGSDGTEHPVFPFPGKVNNCEACHTQEQYNLPNQQNTRPSNIGTADAPKYFSPTLVVCSSCHLKSALGLVTPDSPAAGDEWASHMKDNGAVFGAATMEAATGTEQCASCHAVGQEQGVDKVHKVYDFR